MKSHHWSVATVGLILVVASVASAQAPSKGAKGPKPPEGRAKAVAEVVAANHILANRGVFDGYGHVSVRDPANPNRFLMSRSMAPELVTPADVLEHDLEGGAPGAPPDTKLYNERFIHAEIYRANPEVNAVVHCHAPSLIPFGVTGVALRPIYHMSSFLGGGVPVFDIRAAARGSTDMLVRTPDLGKALAKTLGQHPVALMRGHGAVIVGRDIQQVVFRSVYTEMNAQLQAQAMALGKRVVYLDAEEAKKAEESNNGTMSRPWELWLRELKKE